MTAAFDRPALPTPATSRRCRGWSLVELLVGLAIGLWLASMATVWTLTRVRDDARLLADARLTTDLAAALASVGDDLRRAGFWGHAASWVLASTAAASAVNPYTTIEAVPGGTAYRYSRDAVENDTLDSNEQFGWRLHGPALELQLGGGGWQAVTDPAALRITRFDIVPSVQTALLADLCPTPCPAEAADCPARVEVRTYTITVQGRATGDPTVERTATTTVRVRNDALVGHCGD